MDNDDWTDEDEPFESDDEIPESAVPGKAVSERSSLQMNGLLVNVIGCHLLLKSRGCHRVSYHMLTCLSELWTMDLSIMRSSVLEV